MKCIVVVLFCLSPFLAAAQIASDFHIKSWKTGTAEAKPQTLIISLTKADPVYHKLISDTFGQPLYRLTVEPAAFIGPGDGIIAWHVYLTAPDSRENLLLPSNSLEQEEYERPDYLWWFYPGQNRLVPLEAERFIQVEGSYLTLKADDVHLDHAGHLESMKLTAAFSHTPPGSAP